MPLINVTPADAETALNRLERGFALLDSGKPLVLER
jgi:hypothetical protein